jgi:hypothetical protein
MRYIELRRHTDNDADRLTSQGVSDAERIGHDGLHPAVHGIRVDRGATRHSDGGDAHTGNCSPDTRRSCDRERPWRRGGRRQVMPQSAPGPNTGAWSLWTGRQAGHTIVG